MNPILAIVLITWVVVMAMILANAGDVSASFGGLFDHLQAPK